MEEGNVVVDAGDGSRRREPSDPPRKWWLPMATFIGVAVAVVVVVATQRSAEELPDNPPEASPAATTTTTPPTTTTLQLTTTTPPLTTTSTIAVGQTIRVLANLIEPDIRAFCERASPLGTDELDEFGATAPMLKEVGEWRQSLNDEDFWTLHGEPFKAVLSEIGEVWVTLDVTYGVLLNSISDNFMDADFALHGAVQAADEGDSDEWTHSVARIERFCSRATTTIATMVAMSRN
jgi:hypothetical protein